MANGCSTSEPVSIATLCGDVAEGVQANADQQWGRSIFLVDTALDVFFIPIHNDKKQEFNLIIQKQIIVQERKRSPKASIKSFPSIQNHQNK